MLSEIVYRFQKSYIVRLLLMAIKIHRVSLEFRIERGLPVWDGKRVDVTRKSISILKLLGEGTYGYVSSVRCNANRKTLAYKHFEEPECQSSFRELYSLSSLAHPSIIPLVGIVTNAKGIITGYLMPCASQSLMDLIRIIPPPASRSARITSMLDDIGYDATQGISYLHQNAFLHRDIKPDNILLLNGHACISDFGLATIIPEGPCLNTGEVHTAFYRAPELWDLSSSQTRYGPEVDIYALGVTLIYMYTGSSNMSQSGLLISRALGMTKPYKLVRSILRTLDPFKNVPTRLLRLMTSYMVNSRPSANEIMRNWKVITKYREVSLTSRAVDSYKKGIHRRLSGSPTDFRNKCSGEESEIGRESYMIAHLRSRKPKMDLLQLSQIATQLVTYAGLSPNPKTWNALNSLCKAGGQKKLSRQPHISTSELEKYLHQRLTRPKKGSRR